MFNELNDYMMKLKFIQLVPIFMFIFMGIGILMLVLRDRYRRHITLKRSSESAKIEQMLLSGKLSSQEAELLHKQCSSLPQNDSISVVPDLPLRVAGAITGIYGASWLLTLWLLVVGKLLTLIRGFNNTGNAVSVEDTVSVIAMIIVMASLALVSIIAMWITLKRGSLMARNVVVGIWLIFIALSDTGLYGSMDRVWLLLSLGGGIYAIYTAQLQCQNYCRTTRGRSNTEMFDYCSDSGFDCYKHYFRTIFWSDF